VSILARYNELDNPDVVQVGEKLKIPKAIEVRSGDVLSEIARRNKEPLDFIVKVNAIQKPDVIHIGQTIWI
jgi:LysM repeat protein